MNNLTSFNDLSIVTANVMSQPWLKIWCFHFGMFPTKFALYQELFKVQRPLLAGKTSLDHAINNYITNNLVQMYCRNSMVNNRA